MLIGNVDMSRMLVPAGENWIKRKTRKHYNQLYE